MTLDTGLFGKIPAQGDFVRLNGRSYMREPLDADWILSRFPPDRDAAVRG